MSKNRYIIIFLIVLALILTPLRLGGGLLSADSGKTERERLSRLSNGAEKKEGARPSTQASTGHRNENYRLITELENYVENSGYYDENDKVNGGEDDGHYEITAQNNSNGDNSDYLNGFDKNSAAKNREYYDGFGITRQNSYLSPKSRASIDFVYRGRTIRYVDEIITPTDHLVAETIHERRINAPPEEKLRIVEKCVNAGASFEKAMTYCFPLLKNTVLKLKKSVDSEPVDSTITFSPDKRPMFTITKDKNGAELIPERLYRDIYGSLRRSPCAVINVVPKILYPAVTAQANISATKLRASYTTSYANSTAERRHNIELAFNKLNGKTIKPDEEFSFNKAVGRRNEKNGFKSAKIIFKGEYVDGVGGGVCQVSTALYNCIIRADLTVTQVRNHSLSSSYVPASFDAMVNSDSSDLRFKNNSELPVFIRTRVGSGETCVEIYGTRLPYKISTESVIVSITEPPPDKTVVDYDYKYVNPDAEPGVQVRVNYSHGAIKSEGYLLYYSHSGKLLEKRLIRKDSYNSCAGLIAVAPPRENQANENSADKNL